MDSHQSDAVRVSREQIWRRKRDGQEVEIVMAGIGVAVRRPNGRIGTMSADHLRRRYELVAP